MQVLAVSNMKGGTGKTATAVNLAPVFAGLGVRTLVVDTEPQGDASAVLGVKLDIDTPALAQVLMGTATFADVAVEVAPNLTVLPAASDVAEVQELHRTREQIDDALVAALGDAAAAGHELAIIDTQPNTFGLSRAALHYADIVLGVVNARDMNSLKRLENLRALMDEVGTDATLRILIGQAVLGKAGAFRRRVHSGAHDYAVQRWGAAVLDSIIPDTALLQEQTADGRRPVTIDRPDSVIAGAYRALAAELIESPAGSSIQLLPLSI